MMAVATVMTLNEVCDLIVDCEHKTAPIQSEGYPSIRTPNIGRGRLILDGVNRVSEETYIKWTQRELPQSGDLILAREAPIGNVAIVPSNLKVCLGQRTVLIRPNRNRVDPNYLVYLLLGDEIQGRIQSLSNGATVHHLNMSDIRNLKLPELPSLPIQHKIAAILSAYDDLIENNTRRIAILEAMAQALYREWFVNFRFPGHEGCRMVDSPLRPIPEGWQVVELADVADLERKGIEPSRYPDEIFAHYSVPAYDEGRMPNLESGDSIKSNKFLIPNNCVLVSKINPRIPRVWLPTPANAAQLIGSTEFLVLVPRPPYSREYLHGIVSLPAFLDEMASRAAGTSTSHQRLKSDDFMKSLVVAPHPNLIQTFTDEVGPALAFVNNLRLKNADLRRTRDLLLPKLVSGSVDVAGLEIMSAKADV